INGKRDASKVRKEIAAILEIDVD
ncbi:XRE family transcriptional regulator, partial [Listeria monocytogenes]|nr:XRE family transcriptional regulator [Listeria monocytogenes]